MADSNITIIDSEYKDWLLSLKSRYLSGQTNLFPSQPIHPGEMLKDELEYRNVNLHDFADEIGISVESLKALLEGNRAVTMTDSLLLEAALGIEADLWTRLQSDYNKQVALSDSGFRRRLDKIRQYAAML